MKLLFVSAELAPLAQTGGLGDAVSGLAASLTQRGHEVCCALPAYAGILEHPECPRTVADARFDLPAPGGVTDARWRTGRLENGVQLWLLEAADLYGSPEIYGPLDLEVPRWAGLCRAAAIRALEYQPNVIVAHDWPAALVITTLRSLFDSGASRGIGTLQIVHNNAYQGRFPGASMASTSLPPELFRPDGLEFFGDLCLLKGGLLWADRIAAVSPQYARELCEPEFGEGLDGVYRMRGHRLVGIANGIDVSRHDPMQDSAIPAAFGPQNIDARGRGRALVLAELGLEAPKPGRFLGAVGRFAEQKGWDVLADAIPELVNRGASLALVGDGDPKIATRLRAAARRFPKRVRVEVGWNDRIARRVYAAADAILIPSRFEPCGLVQLLAQRYGALPIAHRVGGLIDTILDGQTGVLFSPLDTDGLVQAVERGAALAEEEGPTLTKRLLGIDVSWDAPSERWEELLTGVADEASARQ